MTASTSPSSSARRSDSPRVPLRQLPADELARAKGEAALEFSRTFEATGRISSRLQALELLVAFDLPDDYYSTYAQAIQEVSAADVQRVATRYLDPAHLVIAIAGDRKTIEPRIRAAGFEPVTPVGIDELFAAPKYLLILTCIT